MKKIAGSLSVVCLILFGVSHHVDDMNQMIVFGVLALYFQNESNK